MTEDALKFESRFFHPDSYRIQHEWDKIAFELDSHIKLIGIMGNSLELEMKNLITEYRRISNSEISELDKTNALDDIDVEGNNFETYNEVYLNSFYINIYSIFENTLLRICTSYCIPNSDDLKKKLKGNLSFIEKYLNIIKETVNYEFTEIQSEFNLFNSEYRTLRNYFIHSRYVCTSKEIENLKNLESIGFISSGLGSNLKPQIENKEFIIDFIKRVKSFLHELYVIFYKKFMENK